MLKGIGYLVSTLSVILLGIVAWDGASKDRMLLACLIAGMASSMTGMFLRWLSHEQDRRQTRKSGQATQTTNSAR